MGKYSSFAICIGVVVLAAFSPGYAGAEPASAAPEAPRAAPAAAGSMKRFKSCSTPVACNATAATTRPAS